MYSFREQNRKSGIRTAFENCIAQATDISHLFRNLFFSLRLQFYI